VEVEMLLLDETEPSAAAGSKARLAIESTTNESEFGLRDDARPRTRKPRDLRGFLMCRRRDSNPRHADYDSAALTD
jgi:hypothetical protein